MNFKSFKKEHQKTEVWENFNKVNFEPLVSVCVQTYQHVGYIRQCLDGILMQETSFPYEILLGDDDSNDGTREICIEYAEKYPDIIRLFLHHRKNNIQIDGSPTGRFNFMYNLYSARGEYIALCEGDDYWIDPLKLQKQVDFLEHNQHFAGCFHNIDVLNNREGENKVQQMHRSLEKTEFSTTDLLGQWFIPTGSLVFLNRQQTQPEWFAYCGSGDIPLILLLSLQGKIKYLNEIMGVYRLHDTGISIGHSGYTKVFSMIFIYQNFNIYTNSTFQTEINDAMIYEVRKHLPEVKELKKIKNRSLKIRVKKLIQNIKRLYS